MIGAECYSNPAILNASSGAGHVTNIGGLNSYVTGSPLSILVILLFSDVYGYKAPLLRKIADKVAATGYYVVVPDLFNGEPYDPQNVNRPFTAWLKDHAPEKGFEQVAKPVISALKSNGASAFGVAGFCWGANTVTKLGKSKLAQASVLLHPSYITVEDISGVEIPIAILGAEHDSLSPPKLLKQFKQVLKAKPKVDSYVKVFPNVSHGWTVRYDPKDPKAVKAADKAHHIMIDWFDKHLK